MMEKIEIGGFGLDRELVDEYIRHFARDKTGIEDWEFKRKELHDKIFESIGLDRFSDKGKTFSRIFDAWAEPEILKVDPVVAMAKRVTNAETKDEIEKASAMLQIEAVKQSYKDEIAISMFGGLGEQEETKELYRKCLIKIDNLFYCPFCHAFQGGNPLAFMNHLKNFEGCNGYFLLWKDDQLDLDKEAIKKRILEDKEDSS